jgi:hypothetical protein
VSYLSGSRHLALSTKNGSLPIILTMPPKKKAPPSAAQHDPNGLEGDPPRPSQSYRPSRTRDSRHMVQAAAPKKGVLDNNADDDSSVNSSGSDDSTPFGDRKPPAARKRDSSDYGDVDSTAMTAGNTVSLLSSSDSDISLCQEISDGAAVFNVYIAMSDLLNSRANSLHGHSPETLVQILQDLVTNRDALFNIMNGLEGGNQEETMNNQFKATMLYTAIPFEQPNYRQRRKKEVVESLIKIWKTTRSVNVALSSQSVISGRRRSSTSPALDAFGNFASLMLQAEYICSNAQKEKEAKFKMMKTVKITGEFTQSVSFQHILHLTLVLDEEMNRPWQGFNACGLDCAFCDHGLTDYVEDPKEINKRNRKKRSKYEKEVERSKKEKEAAKRKNPVEDYSDGYVSSVFL